MANAGGGSDEQRSADECKTRSARQGHMRPLRLLRVDLFLRAEEPGKVPGALFVLRGGGAGGARGSLGCPTGSPGHKGARRSLTRPSFLGRGLTSPALLPYRGRALFTELPRALILGNLLLTLWFRSITPDRSSTIPDFRIESFYIRATRGEEGREEGGKACMPTYVALMNWTDQGVRTVGDTVHRREQADALADKHGAKIE